MASAGKAKENLWTCQQGNERKSAFRGNLISRELKGRRKNFSRRTTRKLFQFAKIAHQSKTEFPQTVSRNKKEKAKNVSRAFNQCYKVIYASCLRIQSEHIFLCDLNRDTRALLRHQLRENVKIERDAEEVSSRSASFSFTKKICQRHEWKYLMVWQLKLIGWKISMKVYWSPS